MKVSISDCFSIIRNGASIKQSEGAGGIPITRIETIALGDVNLKKVGYANIYDDKSFAAFYLQNGDILMSHINSLKHLAKTAIVKNIEEQRIIHGMNLLLLRANNKVNPFYTKYYFQTTLFYSDILRIANQSVNQCSFTVGNLKKLQIPLPPLSTQKAIAEKLDKADALRKKDQELLKYYDELAQSVFIDMFGNVQENNKNFETKKGSELFKLSSGKFNPTKNLDDSYEFPTYGGNGITGYSREYLIDLPTIIIGRVGVYCGSIHKSTGKSWITDNAIFLKEFYYDLNLTFLEFVLNHNNLNRFADYSGQPKITQKPIENLKIIIPPLPLQQKFANIIENIEEQKKKVKLQAQESENLFQALLQESFS